MRVRDTLEARKAELARLMAENGLIQREIDEFTVRMEELAGRLEVSREATQFLESMAASRRGSAKGRIESVASEALRLIYGPEYGVEMEYGVKNNRSCLDIFMVRDTPEGKVRRQIDGIGGGVSDAISVPLRLMVLMGSRQCDRVCVLDECYKHMDAERIVAVAEFLRDVASRLSTQVVMATHHEPVEAMADKVFRIHEKSGASTVK